MSKQVEALQKHLEKNLEIYRESLFQTPQDDWSWLNSNSMSSEIQKKNGNEPTQYQVEPMETCHRFRNFKIAALLTSAKLEKRTASRLTVRRFGEHLKRKGKSTKEIAGSKTFLSV